MGVKGVGRGSCPPRRPARWCGVAVTDVGRGVNVGGWGHRGQGGGEELPASPFCTLVCRSCDRGEG